jgi:hypothetical protein
MAVAMAAEKVVMVFMVRVPVFKNKKRGLPAGLKPVEDCITTRTGAVAPMLRGYFCLAVLPSWSRSSLDR